MTLPPVILLHGCGGSPEQAFVETGWIAAFEQAGRKVEAIHLPGHGHDNPPHDPAAYGDLAGMLEARLFAKPVDLVGFSLGAKLSLDLALRFGGLVRRMVLGGIGDNAFAPEAVGDAAAHALERGLDDTTPPPVRVFFDHWNPALNDPLAVAAVLRRSPNPVFTSADFADFHVPVAVVNGGDDFVVQMGTQLIEALGVPQHLIPGVGHFDLTAQAEFLELALDFLGQTTNLKEPRP